MPKKRLGAEQDRYEAAADRGSAGPGQKPGSGLQEVGTTEQRRH